ncbi:MAG: CBS domain-containing protein [Thermoproteota archaeon]|nr:CBS domain-containing protein [Thermoproteota archaeon]
MLDIASKPRFSLHNEDPISKAVTMMVEHRLEQIPVTNENGLYTGMLFSRKLVESNCGIKAKVKTLISTTPILNPESDLVESASTLVLSGFRALPIVVNGIVIGIVSQKDIVINSDFHRGSADEVMSGAIVIPEEEMIGNAITKMRRYHISRLPVINSEGLLKGIVDNLDTIRIIYTPRESERSIGSEKTYGTKRVRVREVMRSTLSSPLGSRLQELVNILKNSEEVVIVENAIPIGIITPKDMIETILPKKKEPTIHIAHAENDDVRKEIETVLAKLLNRIHAYTDIQYIIAYVDRHKQRKYSVRCRMVTPAGVISARSVGFDVSSAGKLLVQRLYRRVMSQHNRKVTAKTRSELGRI